MWLPSAENSNLYLAKNAIRFVKWTCVIGASTHHEDVEKTKSIKDSRAWCAVSVSILRYLHKIESTNRAADIEDCFSAVTEWQEKICKIHKTNVIRRNMSHGTPKLVQLKNGLKEYSEFVTKIKTICNRIYNQENADLYFLHQQSELAIEQRCGNCGEQAAVAFIYLLKRNIAPLELFSVENGDHCFVVLGRSIDSDEKNIKSWKNAVICDPFANTAFIACESTEKQLKDLLGENHNARPHCDFRVDKQYYIDKQQKQTTEPNIVLSLADLYRCLIKETLDLGQTEYNEIVKELAIKCKFESAVNRINKISRHYDISKQPQFINLCKLLTSANLNNSALAVNSINDFCKPRQLNEQLKSDIQKNRYSNKV